MGEERSDWSIPMRSWGVLSAERESWLAIDPKGRSIPDMGTMGVTGGAPEAPGIRVLNGVWCNGVSPAPLVASTSAPLSSKKVVR